MTSLILVYYLTIIFLEPITFQAVISGNIKTVFQNFRGINNQVSLISIEQLVERC